jgi:hypothetical protein
MLQDLKNACRALLKNPWFTCITVLTLALGIGANTAIFGVVNKLLLNPLPYANSDRLSPSSRKRGVSRHSRSTGSRVSTRAVFWRMTRMERVSSSAWR